MLYLVFLACSIPMLPEFVKGGGTLYEGGQAQESVTDSGLEDTGTTTDTGSTTDTGVQDSANEIQDTSSQDTGTNDDSTEDTSTEDTASEDTSTEETGLEDTGTGDSGG